MKFSIKFLNALANFVKHFPQYSSRLFFASTGMRKELVQMFFLGEDRGKDFRSSSNGLDRWSKFRPDCFLRSLRVARRALWCRD
jgi:hypothetical protein